MPFDPKAYLADSGLQKKSGFDPKDYLKDQEPADDGSGVMDRVAGLFTSDGRAKLADTVDRARTSQAKPKHGLGQTELESFGNGATLGYLPHLQALAEPVTNAIGKAVTGQDVTSDDYVDARDKNIKRMAEQRSEHPLNAGLGTLAGGLALSPLAPESAATTVAGKVGHGVAVGAGFGAAANPGDTEGEVSPLQLKGRAGNAAIGAFTGGTISGGLAGAKALGEMMRLHPKANAEQIKAAAEALGITPTAGMLNDNKVVQDLESSLHQSPTVGGTLMRRETRPVGKGMLNASNSLFEDANGLSPDQSGAQAKNQIGAQVNSEFQPHRDAFNDLKQYTSNINAPESSRNAVSRNVMNIPEVQVFKNEQPANVARDVVSALGEDPSADMIKKLKTMVGTKAASADPEHQQALWQIYAKLARLEENTIKRGVISAARTQGEGSTIADGMLGQLKGARQGWKAGMDKLGGFSDAQGMRTPNSPENFLGNVDNIQNEKMQTSMFNPNDNVGTNALKDSFPKAYDTLRGGRLTEMQGQLSGEGGVNPGKLLNATKKNTPEANTHLFREDGAKTLGDLRTVDQSLPDKVGPSGTPAGDEVKQVMNPLVQASGVAKYGLYKGLTNQTLQGFLSKMPQLGQLQQTNPQAFNALVLGLSRRTGAAGMSRAADNREINHDPTQEKTISQGEAQDSFLKGN
jgi:hypothetical protein